MISTYVEMILVFKLEMLTSQCDLHVCGDDPISVEVKLFKILWSPRMWRWSWSTKRNSFEVGVISTYVEMIPTLISVAKVSKSDLHVCGDDPMMVLYLLILVQWSPRMWRWSSFTIVSEPLLSVISTYVEMILVLRPWLAISFRDLHVCGDDPHTLGKFGCLGWWSPRMWRWSLTEETYDLDVGSDLHVCGDDPSIAVAFSESW